MLIGEYRHAVDDKGRLFVPARLRDELGEPLVVTRGLDQCLFVFPPGEWQSLEAKLRALPLAQSSARAFVRLLLSGASECVPDKQGRILLPQALREYAGIDREAVLIGVGNRVEIWAAERWTRYVEEASEAYAQIAEQIVDLGI
ncbi:MAG TPA: division/cell wall cluster transcriptional repressor MraZ [Thermaerobacter sp.]